eukprot:Phypoly_transcript_15640.p1 GENE.Phypoly_transcript_15640~~Phypoly_transcript_15640.p1  ORF type:complete len:144 (+),score=8.47 Phypoly_transcript_15640:135-566(+)
MRLLVVAFIFALQLLGSSVLACGVWGVGFECKKLIAYDNGLNAAHNACKSECVGSTVEVIGCNDEYGKIACTCEGQPAKDIDITCDMYFEIRDDIGPSVCYSPYPPPYTYVGAYCADYDPSSLQIVCCLSPPGTAPPTKNPTP